LARLLRDIHRRISRYAPADAPCSRTKIHRNPVDLFISDSLKSVISIKYPDLTAHLTPGEEITGNHS